MAALPKSVTSLEWQSSKAKAHTARPKANGQGCTYGKGCGNPARWPVKVKGITALQWTCSTHKIMLVKKGLGSVLGAQPNKG
jgi:hypothetical protein